MQISKMVKHVFVYLSLLIVIAMVIGLLITKDLHQNFSGTRVPVIAQPNNSTSLPSSTSTRTCTLPNVYTSLPAKCRMADGQFVAGDWSSPTIVIPYELK